MAKFRVAAKDASHFPQGPNGGASDVREWNKASALDLGQTACHLQTK